MIICCSFICAEFSTRAAVAAPTREEVHAEIVSGDPAVAEKMARERWLEQQALHGSRSLEAVLALDDVVEVQLRRPDSQESEVFKLARSSFALKRAADAPLDAYAVSVGHLAAVAKRFGHPELFKEITRHARPLWHIEPGAYSKALAVAFNNLAFLAIAANRHEAALAFTDEALRHAQPEFRVTPKTKAAVLTNRGVALYSLLRFDEARRDLVEALNIKQSLPSVRPSEIRLTLAVLAGLEGDAGNLTEATDLSEQALQLTSGGPHQGPDVALLRCNTAILFHELGDNERAREHSEEGMRIASSISDGARTESHCRLVRGAIFEAAGELEKAEQDDAEAVRLRQKTLGESDLTTLQAQVHLAGVHAMRTRDAEARSTLLATAARLLRNEFVANDVVEELDAVARYLEGLGQPEAARRMARQALERSRRSKMQNQLLASTIMARLSRLELTLGNRTGARSLAREVERRGQELLGNALLGLPELGALRLAAARARGLDVLLALAEPAARPDRAAIEDAWSSVVRARAFVSDGLVERQKILLDSSSPERKELWDRLVRNQQRLAELKMANLSPDQRALAKQRASELEEEAGRIYRLLGERGVLMRHRTNQPGGVDLLRVLGSLPIDASLISYVRYETPMDHEPRYGVFVSGVGGSISQFLPLGPASKIDPLVAAWRATFSADSGGVAVASPQENLRTGSELRTAIWDPIAASIKNYRELHVVMDGQLSLVMLEALPDGGGGFLVDSAPAIRYSDAERDLLPAQQVATGQGLLYVGKLDYGAAPDRKEDGWSFWSWLGLRGNRSSCEDPIGRGFNELRSADAEREFHALERAWEQSKKADSAPDGSGMVLLVGREASRDRLREVVRGRRALHFSTHGFVADPDCNARSDAKPSGLLNPLHLAGLALSGANQARSRNPGEPLEGVLLADEVTTLDLRGVEWVTLSACDTAVGPSVRNEGVLSLRRAFLQAQAGSVVSSLWKVEDSVAADWMEIFYRERLKPDGSTAKAARIAQRTLLARRRAAGQSTHPFWWAGFVAVGR